jgi:hypothetical protein
MSASQSMMVSLVLQEIAEAVNGALKTAAGEEIAFVLVCQADKVAQYVSNTKREDGAALIESLLARWKAGRADIPAHYNPDLANPDKAAALPDRLDAYADRADAGSQMQADLYAAATHIRKAPPYAAGAQDPTGSPR